MLNNSRKLILCATNSNLTAGLWHGSKLQTYAVFGNTSQDHTAFSEYLAKNNDTNIYLIVDAVEEDYRVESLPHTTGGAINLIGIVCTAPHTILIVRQISVKMIIFYL
jgi:hypothetical protein